MKWIIAISLILMLSCHTKKNNSLKDSFDGTQNKKIQFLETRLIEFMDSIVSLNPDIWIKEHEKLVDSVLQNQTTLNHQLSSVEFLKLIEAVETKEIDLETAKSIFPKLKIDAALQEHISNNKLPIDFHSFDRNNNDFKQFAIVIGSDAMSWNNDVYFFINDRIVAKHNIYHRSGLNVQHFKDDKNNTIVYYSVNFGSGSGIWWYQFNFYKFTNDELVPVLTEINNINLQFPWSIRSYWVETEIVQEKPLQIKFAYNVHFFDSVETQVEFINDSTILNYRFNEDKGKYIADFENSNLDRGKLCSYFHLDNELLFVNAHYSLLKQGIDGNDLNKRKAIFHYLNELMNIHLKRKD
jgi:hypothetical protein